METMFWRVTVINGYSGPVVTRQRSQSFVTCCRPLQRVSAKGVVTAYAIWQLLRKRSFDKLVGKWAS